MDTSELEDLIARAPVNRLLGHRLVSRTAEEAVVALEPRQDFVQEAGRIHGGILAALGDSTAVYLLVPDLPDDRTMTSIEFKLNFLHPAAVGGPELISRARPVRRGRTVAVCDVEIAQGDETVAKGLYTYLFFERTARG